MKKVLLISALALMLLTTAGTASAARVSCKNFDNQAQAQAYYDARRQGWKGLDRDSDGEPCECLPGGSKYGESVCWSWRKKYKK
ncbi:MAG: excalibur calcium-binding domain-containing protein [Thiothrix sp.]|nr:excalibur calcium-binding domain-containing protein [Thiothrix sp.]HPE59092.1 excalibur calcium-binding domain-containing protein [Thiolinea sp.]